MHKILLKSTFAGSFRFQLFSQSLFQHYITLDCKADSEKSNTEYMRQSKYICQSLSQGC